MADIIPFKGILYNKNKIDNISKVVAPPYDAILKGELENYYKISPYNITHLILPKDYHTSARLFKEWLRRGVLVQDRKEAIYLYEQEYKIYGKAFKRTGFIALLKIEDYSTNRIFPHENTFDGPKQDRLLLLKEVKANLCPVFFVFPHKRRNGFNLLLERYAKTRRPRIEVCAESKKDRLWRICEPSLIRIIRANMKDRPLFIADGHHRYEVAVALKENYPYVMGYFCDASSSGLTILPTHRMVKDINLSRVGRFFSVTPVYSKEEMFSFMERKKRGIFGLYTNGRFYILTLKDLQTLKLLNSQTLDVSILHSTILKGIKDIAYTSDAKEAINTIDKGIYKAAFFLEPTSIKEVMDYALSGIKMPHKSTYFYPKLMSGLVMNKFDCD